MARVHRRQLLRDRAVAASRGPVGGPRHGAPDSVVGLAKELEESADARPVTLWTDAGQAPQAKYDYRIRGFNASGATEYSPVLAVAAP